MIGIRKLFVLLFLPAITFSQVNSNALNVPARPKLVVGLVIDQMRWDYLYRYYDLYGNDGFKRLLKDGFSCENTFINYLPSYTAVGHSCIFTGSVPSINGIAGNDWYDKINRKTVYCTDDSTVQGVGSNSDAGKMSPANLLTSTVTDELRLATNFQSKVVGVSLKDRASILPAGHTANAAFWVDDKTGNFISSTYYMQQLPGWVTDFNKKQYIREYLRNSWQTLYPISSYTQSTADDKPYEGKFSGEAKPVFPHDLKTDLDKNPGIIRSTPFGNTLTLQFAKEAIRNYALGQEKSTDFITINCASTDYVAHKYGPNSIEVEDTYLRLDKDLAGFFQFLDSTIGKGQYLLFLTADHGAAHAIGFMQENKIPADHWNERIYSDSLNLALQQKFGTANLVLGIGNYQVYLSEDKIVREHLDRTAIRNFTIQFLQQMPGVMYVIDVENIGYAPIPEPIKTMVINGYNSQRSGDIQIVLQPGWFEGSSKTGTTHGSWNPYDTHIPLLFYGWHITPGSSNKTVHMEDIAPTVAALLHIQMPNGCIGQPITAVLK